MEGRGEASSLNEREITEKLTHRDFRSLDEYLDYLGIERDYRPAYRQWFIAWLKLGDEKRRSTKLFVCE